MLGKIKQQGLVKSGKLFRALTWKMRMRNGEEVDRISWQAPRYGFVMAHVGRKYTVDRKKTAAVWGVNKSGKRYIKKYDKYELNSNSGPADWFFDILDKEVPGLGDMVANMKANRVVNASDILTTAKKMRAK